MAERGFGRRLPFGSLVRLFNDCILDVDVGGRMSTLVSIAEALVVPLLGWVGFHCDATVVLLNGEGLQTFL